MRSGPLSLADLAACLADPDCDPSRYAEALTLDPARSNPFRPLVRVNPDQLLQSEAPNHFLDGISAHIRRHRQRHYADRVARGWDGPRLIADGDSWFHFPLARDLIRQLDADHAIHCLSGAGDPLHNPISRTDLCNAIVEHRPDAVLLSIGGSDVLAGQRFAGFIEPFASERPAPAYISETFSRFLSIELMPRFVALLGLLRSVDADVPILLHSYAHAIPRDFIWLGRPLRSLGIEQPLLQRQIIAALVDRFYESLVASIADAGLRDVHVVDCRSVVGGDWFDELHPNNRGFEKLANCFRAALAMHC